MQTPPETTAQAQLKRPPVEAADLNPQTRPGVPAERPPRPWPNSRFPPERMTAPPAVPTHGRPGKAMPPVYGTAEPLRGASGAIRRLAYHYPDHVPAHWLLLLLGDRVDAWGTRARHALPLLAPTALAAFATTLAVRRMRD